MLAANPISILLEAIFAMLNIALSVVFGLLGTVGTFALAGVVLVGALVLVASLLRAPRR